MAIATLRILTEKSKLNFGPKAKLTVKFLLDNRDFYTLICAYYKFTSINFTPDILEKLKITGDWVISKPSKNPELLQNFLETNGYELNISDGRDKKKTLSSSYLESLDEATVNIYAYQNVTLPVNPNGYRR